MTTPSLYKSTGLNLSVFKPIINTAVTPVSYIAEGEFLENFTEQVSSWQHTIAAWGGYDTASFTIKDRQDRVETWLDDGLGRCVVCYSPALDTIWQGFVNQVSASLGRLSVTRGPLIDSANRISVVYSTIDTSVSPPIMGVRVKTAAVNNTDAQAKYGVIEKVLSTGGATQANAEQIRSTYLLENAWSPTTSGLGETGSEPSVTLDCLGYVHWFKTYVYNYTANSGTQNLSTKLQAVIDAQLNTIISGYDIASNTLAMDRYENDDKTAWDLLKALTAMGDANSARYLFGVYAGRRAKYEVAPTSEIAYQMRLGDPSQRVETLAGTEIKPWNVLPGRWLFLPDFLVGKTQPVTLRTDPRYIFIESVTFTTPNGLSMQGGKVDTLPQKMARMGLGGVA